MWKKSIFPIFTIILIIASVMTGVILSQYTARVSGDSMLPTLHPNDIVYGVRYPSVSQLRHNDIVVVNDQHKWSGKNELLVKRIIGLPGDTLTIGKDGRMKLNGVMVNGENAYTSGCPLNPSRDTTIIIPDNKIFVRGDNVNVSNDSRYTYCNVGNDYLIDANQIRIRETGVIHMGSIISVG
jgi:signal peptidase I